MGLPIDQQRRQLLDYLNRKDYARAYTYIAVQIRGDARWDQRIVGWLGQAANINRTGARVTSKLEGSLAKAFVWRMNNLASIEENGRPISRAENQAASDKLVEVVVSDYLNAISAGTSFTTDALRLRDVASAVDGLRVSQASWAGGPLGMSFGFDMFGFNGTSGVFKSSGEVRTWINRAQRVMQGILVTTHPVV